MTIIMDSLDSLDFATGTGCCADVPSAVSDVHEQGCMMENSPKPILITTHDEKGLQAIMDICTVYKGSMDAFAKGLLVVNHDLITYVKASTRRYGWKRASCER